MSKKTFDNVLSAPELFGASSPLTKLEVPELSGAVYLRPLSAGSILRFAEMKDGEQKTGEQFRLVAEAMVTKNGERIVSVADEKRIGEMPAGAFTRILKAITSDVLGEDEPEGGADPND